MPFKMAIYHHPHSPPSFLPKIFSDRKHVQKKGIGKLTGFTQRSGTTFKVANKVRQSSNNFFLFLKMHWWNVSRDSRVLVHIRFNMKIIF